ncbi:MAG: ABC transporter ATP-binding protein [Nanoarchaeota archaeon]|nr:ABC transporter ATP-binding protein [Nanoarchaeota archaeon]
MGKSIVRALRGLSLKITEDEFVAMVGASGSGKSTAMHLMGCLDTPSHGKVIFEGKDILNLSSNELATIRRERIGFVFQTFNLMNTMSALDNVLLPTVFKNDDVNYEKRARDLLKEVGLSHRIAHKPSELSGGERQRIAIARSLINDPEVVFADEPTGNLDSVTGRKVMNFLKRVNKVRKKTIVIVTHDLELAKEADRIIKLKDGVRL